MNTKCLIVDDDVTIAENTAEYFNMLNSLNPMKYLLSCWILISVTGRVLNYAKRFVKTMICPSFSSVPEKAMIMR